ncbi:DUF2752 domain-containing protein [Flavihumibacter sp. CACIAM 22H1]|uniref:DUF2752 domain-containing protein n=1 Tax=Flavihumibacter sp. CACIAM 22H1 TaxID=1812911 RepID=UPI00344CC0F0
MYCVRSWLVTIFFGTYIPIPAIFDRSMANICLANISTPLTGPMPSNRCNPSGEKIVVDLEMTLDWIRRNFEAITWIGALLWIGWGVDYGETAPGFCAFRLAGIEKITGVDACPGCGLGRSMAAALHGNWRVSWHHHWIGIPALFIILGRIVTLLITQHKNQLRHGYLPDVPARSSARRSRGHQRPNQQDDRISKESIPDDL